MIKTWKHKGLKKFFETGSTAGIKTTHIVKLGMILQYLDAATKPEDLNLPGMPFHKLKGNLKRYYSVSVSGNWRVIYQFENHNAILVNYVDYH